MRLAVLFLFFLITQVGLSQSWVVDYKDSTTFSHNETWAFRAQSFTNNNRISASVEALYKLDLEIDRWRLRVQPSIFLGDLSGIIFNTYEPTKKISPNYTRLTGNAGLGGIFALQYSINKNTWIDAGWASFSDKRGRNGLLMNGTASPAPYLRFGWRGKHLSFTYLNQIFVNRRGTYPENTFYSREKGFVFHRLAYQRDKWSIGIFESVVWSVKDSIVTRYVDPSYLVPFVFFRPVEYASGSSDNVLLGADAELRFGNWKLYGQFVLDEFKIDEIRSGEGWWANKWAIQAGVSFTKTWSGKRLQVVLEHNRVRPFTYSHSFPAQSLSHNGFPVSHPLGSNFWQQLFEVEYRSSRVCIHGQFSAINLGSRAVADGGDILLSNRNRRADYGFSDVTQGNQYAFAQMRLGYPIDLGKQRFSVGVFAGTRVELTAPNPYWAGIFFSKGLFGNGFAF